MRFAACVALAMSVLTVPALARDDGRYADSRLKPWFDKLASQKGLCCSFADGRTVADPDWGTEPVATADGTQVRYWVRVDGQKIVVPPDALITEPNRDPRGRAFVWPYQDTDGKTQIRCFLRGTES